MSESMKVAVNVNVTGTIDENGVAHPTATYSQGSTHPTSSGVVNSGGDVNLNNMDKKGDFDKKTDIDFYVSGSLTNSQGKNVALSWPTDVGSAFGAVKTDSDSSEFSAKYQSDGSLRIVDKDDDASTWEYTLNLMAGDTPVKLDPKLINRT